MHKQPAQMLVEFAIVAPVLVVLALGILGFGRAFYSYTGITNSAREGARRATLLAPACDSTVLAAVQSAVKTQASGLSITNAEITFTCPTNPDRRTVAVTYPFDTLAPFLGTITMSTTATFPVVNQ